MLGPTKVVGVLLGTLVDFVAAQEGGEVPYVGGEYGMVSSYGPVVSQSQAGGLDWVQSPV